MSQLTLQQSLVLMSSAGAAWLMARAGAVKRLLETRSRPTCASCGRRLTGKTCRCTAD